MNTVSVKAHYDKHLGSFYSWMVGEFEPSKKVFALFCEANSIKPGQSARAIDLGAGHGIQSIALAEIGFDVLAVDFNEQLLSELEQNRGKLPVRFLNEDIRKLRTFADNPELIVCCGDTISHLGSWQEIDLLLYDAFHCLKPGGQMILSFRDNSHAQNGSEYIIPVKQDDHRIFTCILNYFPNKVRVTDLLYEHTADGWEMSVSAYDKVRVTCAAMLDILQVVGFRLKFDQSVQGMSWLIVEKPL